MNQKQEVLLSLLGGPLSTEEIQKETGATYKTLSVLMKQGMVSRRLYKEGRTRVAVRWYTSQGSQLAQKLRGTQLEQNSDNKKLSRFARVKLYFSSLRL